MAAKSAKGVFMRCSPYSSRQQLAQGADIVQRFKMLDGFQSAQGGAVVDRLARALDKFSFKLAGSHGDFGAALGLLDLARESLSILQAQRDPAGAAARVDRFQV